MAKGKRSRRLRNKSEDYEQKYCCSCAKPISQNCFNSEKTGGKCGKCFRDLKENIKREYSKKKLKERNNQRKFKTLSQMTYQ